MIVCLPVTFFVNCCRFRDTLGCVDLWNISSLTKIFRTNRFNLFCAASTFAAAGPTQHPTLPPGYAYFYGGMAPQLQAAYGGVGGTGVYPAAHPGLAVPTASGATASTQFPKGYGSR